MSLIFASVSRQLAGNRMFRCVFALAALFLSGQFSPAQETNAALAASTNPPPALTNLLAATNPPPAVPAEPTPALMLNDTNDMIAAGLPADPSIITQLRATLEDARHLRLMRQPNTAEPILVNLLDSGSPEVIQQSALLELALVAQDQNNLVRAEQIYAQFVGRWSNDKRAPEIFLAPGPIVPPDGTQQPRFRQVLQRDDHGALGQK